MQRILFVCLFLVGVVLALVGFQGQSSAPSDYNSIAIDFRDDLSKTEIDAQLGAIAQRVGMAPQLNSAFSSGEQLYVLAGDRATLKTLRRSLQPLVESVEPNYVYRAFAIPDDPGYTEQWNFRSLNLERAWDETRGAGTIVAVIDTGVSKVQDLESTEFVAGYDFVNDREDASDDVGHGTHVAGTIAQSTNNTFGVAGIAYEASLMPLKVLGADGSGTVADIAESIRFAADNGADVINMSLGGGGESQVMRDAIDYAYDKGVVLVAAAGNADRNAAAYPARYPRVIGVSALDAAGNKAPYSNFGAGVDLSAPGGSDAGKILQHTIDPQTGEAVFAGYQGTSMAAPHVAGVAALVKAVGIEEPEAVARVLTQSVRKVEEDPLNHYGAGQLDAAAAVQLALEGKLNLKDFFRWLRDNGYLNPVFWIDGGMVALPLKLAMVLGSYLLFWLLRAYFPFAWSWPLAGGLVTGSSGWFVARGLYVSDLPQWPLRMLGSSLPELGSALQGNPALNPLTASVLIPLALVVLLLGHPVWKWFAFGASLGVASCLFVSAIADPNVMWLGSGLMARTYLFANGWLCVGLVMLACKGQQRKA
ncbi:subtilisin-like serine protease [Rubidibacter lacunae KORDI 51-2]|uniref:Subtilisin-like serine protease n=1 Tax=Rubidibacter lacunae KORDI 51-2 TaxID=582515 RepID=U5D8J8_9CHRO|nr:S8 family peptidase [Rubidibacter lacunae]ERN40938.1 subtilisin-like serine protease [Rubidibacter lacunae KORDI 51-2]